MGPFVPDIITDQLNLVVALFLGIGFGFVLEQAGFSSSRRLAGLFYGYDFTVLRVFFTAAVTAASGVLLLAHFGLLDIDAIYVNLTWLLPAIVGGAIMGIGFILGGYCPGTGVCAASIGKVDAMFYVGGALLGIFAFGEAFPLYDKFYGSTSLGPIKIYDSLGISAGLFTFLLIAIAVGAFAITTIIEKRVNKTSAPSLQFKPMKHFAAGMAIIALGILFIFMPDRKTSLTEKVSEASYVATHPITAMEADELAFRIVDQEPNIRIIDIRPPVEYTKLALPNSNNIQTNDFFGKDVSASLSQRHIKKIIVGDSEAAERTAYLLLQDLGYENLAILKGGFNEFDRTILNRSIFVPTGTRWDSDVREFRENARVEILKMIEANKNKAPKEITKRKIQGGC